MQMENGIHRIKWNDDDNKYVYMFICGLPTKIEFCVLTTKNFSTIFQFSRTQRNLMLIQIIQNGVRVACNVQNVDF